MNIYEENERELVALLWQTRAFVVRAANAGKKPHDQDKLDALACLPRLEAVLARYPKPQACISDDGTRVERYP